MKHRDNRIWLFLGNLSIRHKMLIILFVLLIVFFLSAFFIYQFMLRDLQNYVIEGNMRVIEFINNDIDAELNSIERAANTLVVNEEIQNYIAPNSTEQDRQALLTLMTRNLYKNLRVTPIPNVGSIMIVLENGAYVFAHLSKTLTEDERTQLASYVLDRYRDTFDSSFITLPGNLSEKAGALSYVLPLSGDLPGEQKAYLVMNINGYFISNIIAKYYSANRSIMVSDREGHVVWRAAALPQMMSFSEDDVYPQTGFHITNTETGKRIELHGRLEQIGWVTTLHVPMTQIQDTLRPYPIVFWLSLSLSLLIAISIYLVFSRMIAGRVGEMSQVINEIREGDLNSRFPVYYQDEISTIGSEFNTMIDQIQYLRLYSVEQKLQQKETELQMLQSQINPHFLYNALESIRMMALVNQDEKVSEQIKILSDLFRYTVQPGSFDSRVTFREEVAHVSRYLDMQRFRFDERCQVDMVIDDDVLPLMTIKLTLQPIVENAFVHGICSLEEGGKIEIRGSIDEVDQIVLFTVTDNGPGISSDQMAALQAMLQDDSEKIRTTSSIGLVNIHDRLRLSFGSRYGLTVSSRLTQGTTVSIRYPVIREETPSC